MGTLEQYPHLWTLHYKHPAHVEWMTMWVNEEDATKIMEWKFSAGQCGVPVEGVSFLPTTLHIEEEAAVVLEPPYDGRPWKVFTYGDTAGAPYTRLGEECDNAKALGL